MTAPTQTHQHKRRGPKPGTPQRPHISATERNERAGRALTMRNAGATFEAIAAQLDISVQQAKNDVTRAVKEWVRVPTEQMVDRQRAILNDIIRTEYPDAVNRQIEAEKRHSAQGKVMEALRDERKLFGLDAPQKVQLGISEEDFARQAVDLLAVTGYGPLLELARVSGEVIDAEVEEEPDEGEPWSNL